MKELNQLHNEIFKEIELIPITDDMLNKQLKVITIICPFCTNKIKLHEGFNEEYEGTCNYCDKTFNISNSEECP